MAPSTTSTVPPHAIGRDTRLALVECGRKAGTWTLGLAATDGDFHAIQAAQAACQRASDLLDVDGRDERGPTPINKMKVVVAQRMVTMAQAIVEIAARGVASDELLTTADQWSNDFTAAMRLLP